MEEKLLHILKQSSTGLTREELLHKAKIEKIINPLEVLKALKNKGLVSIDKHPKPARFKLTPKAFASF